jgi:hypothetical protein
VIVDTSAITADLILAVVTLLAALITRAVLQWVRANVSSANLTTLLQAASIAVNAAEQMAKIGAVEDKLAWATHRLNADLAAAGITLTADQIRAAIEAAVHNEISPSPAPLTMTATVGNGVTPNTTGTDGVFRIGGS